MSPGDLRYQLIGVVRHAGMPMAGLTVQLLANRADIGGDKPLDQFVTTPRGEFGFSVPEGDYTLRVVPDAATRFVTETITDLTISSNTRCDVSMKLGFIVSGSVKKFDGTAAKNFRLTFSNVDGSSSVSQVVDGDGRYNLILSKGQYRIQGSPDFKLLADGEMAYLSYVHDTVDLIGDYHSDLTLPELYVYSGQVLDSSAVPLSGCRVMIAPSIKGALNKKLAFTCITDHSGKFELQLSSGNYDVLIQAPKGSGLSETSQSIVCSGAASKVYTLTAGVQIQGIVSFNGCPVADCRLHARQTSASLESFAITDTQGRFSLRLPEGEYDFSVAAAVDPLKTGDQQASASWSKVLPIKVKTDLNIALERAFIVDFELSDGHDQPIGGATIVHGIYGKEEQSVTESLEVHAPDTVPNAIFTDKSGHCQMILPPGVYFFQFLAPPSSLLPAKTIRQLSISHNITKKVKLLPAGSKSAEPDGPRQLSLPNPDRE